MPLQFSVGLRNNMLDQIEATAGASAKLQIYTGAIPVNCAAAASGTKLVEFTLAADWAAAASSGTKSFSGLPISANAVAAGVAGYFRIVDNAGTTCHMQGTVGTTGADLTLDNTNIAINQTVQVTSWSITAPGA